MDILDDEDDEAQIFGSTSYTPMYTYVYDHPTSRPAAPPYLPPPPAYRDATNNASAPSPARRTSSTLPEDSAPESDWECTPLARSGTTRNSMGARSMAVDIEDVELRPASSGARRGPAPPQHQSSGESVSLSDFIATI